jgi:hypothetical protein
MTDKEKSKHRMYQTVLSVLTEYSSLIQMIPVLAIFIESLKVKVSEIDKYANLHQTVAKGTTDQKNSEKSNLTKDLYTNCRTLTVFAKQTNNMEMLAKVDKAQSEIDRIQDEDIAGYATTVYDLMVANQSELAQYGKTPESIEEFKGLIDSYKKAAENKGNKSTASVVAGKSVKKLISEADYIVKEQIDDLMLNYEKNSPEFFEKYFQARLVKETGVRHDNTNNSPDTNVTNNVQDNTGNKIQKPENEAVSV